MQSTRANVVLLRIHYGLLALSVVLIVLAAAYSVAMLVQMRRSVEWVNRSLDTQAVINHLVAENERIESYGLRYLLSARDDYLRAYVQATFKLDDLLEDLRPRLQNEPAQVDRLTLLEGELSKRKENMRQTIADAQQAGVSASVRRVRDGSGAELLDRIRTHAAELQLAEASLLRSRQDELEHVIVRSTGAVLLINGLALLAGLLAMIALRRSAHAFEASRAAALQAQQNERISREREAFLATISHEIRTPLNAVFGFSQLLARTKVEPRAREYIEAIRTHGNALLTLINDILDLSRIEVGQLRLRPRPTELLDLVESVLAVFRETAAEQGLLLRADFDASVPAQVLIDAQRMRQILSNLVSNAVKFSRDGDVTVRVRAEATARADCHVLHIAVLDCGSGIPAAQQDRVFEPFVRAVGDAAGDAHGGSGLGLAIAKRLIELMGGRIGLDSAPGRGSCFRIELRVRSIDVTAPANAAHVPLPIDFASLQPSRILIVDDVAMNRDLLAAYLADSGHQLAFADNGASAIEIAQRFVPDVVLLDLQMPVLAGRESAQRLRQAFADRPMRVIATTALEASDDAEAAAPIYDAVLRKPISDEALFEALRGLIPVRPSRTPPAPVDAPLKPAANSDAAPDEAGRDRAIRRLQALVEGELAAVTAAMRTREVGQLAAELETLGRDCGSDSIVVCARRLRAALERFDLSALDTLLRGLPALVHGVTAQHRPP